MDREKIVKEFGQDILRIKERGTERSFYPIICSFLEEIIQDKYKNINATVEESLLEKNREIGFPDITIRQNNRLIGWIEVKLPDDSLNDRKFTAQFTRYKDALENILFINLREWQLWQWDDEGKPHKVAEIIFDPSDFPIGQEIKFFDFLEKFFEGRPYEARTPKQLALALAKKTRLLSHQVEEALTEAPEDSDLLRLKNTFEKTLIQDIKPHQFANMIAETVAYSLVLAALEHVRRDRDEELSLTSALDYLPANVPILADLYQLVTKVSKSIPTIYQATHILVDQLKAADIGKIYFKLVEHKAGADPVIQFYEPFLKEYDPKEREARGVYYTPKPVVDYIVRSVDCILSEKFDKPRGLADESVYLLDPATGTGTFLMSAIQQVHDRVEKENKALGEDIVKKEFQQVVVNHILKHFYGFELLVAPYAVAHLKLTLLLEELHFNFKMTENDSDDDNDRLKIYLANTLDDPRPKEKQGSYDALGKIAFPSIPKESEAARKVKKDIPILVITGNPPYSNFGKMNKGGWILDLIKDYKKNLNERKINLDDDFIKFIRFAQWKLEETGQGVFAMITNNSFIDGITHRQMRKCILDAFDEVYIYNLHGSLRKKEICPDGSKDENVFDIQQGVSINIFVKYPKKVNKSIVKYCDLWGMRESKFGILLEEKFNQTKWINISPLEPNWFFVPKVSTVDKEYESYNKVTEIFPYYNSGIQTKRDDLTVHFEPKDLEPIKHDFVSLPIEDIRKKYNLPEDGRDWTIAFAKSDLSHNPSNIVPFLYRPFDVRHTMFTGKSKGFIAYPRAETMRNMFNENLGLVTCRNQTFNLVSLVTKYMIDLRTYSCPGSIGTDYLFPLYLYSEEKNSKENDNLFQETKRKINLEQEFLKKFSIGTGLEFTEKGRGDLEKNYGPEDIFYYTYAIFYCPTYRSRYAEQLKNDFPRLPLTTNKDLFRKLVAKGNLLVNLHLLGENHFDKTKTIFDDKNRWGIKTGGAKHDGIDDWQVIDVRFDEIGKRVYVNSGQYFEGVEKEVWDFFIGGYKVCEKWLKDRKKAGLSLSKDDLVHYMKIIVAIRETIRIMNEIDRAIPSWPIK
jgi:type I restriction-modification system DNA methylase subunit